MSRARVLVVDDSNLTRAVLTRTLQRAGFEVLEACDGIEGAVVAIRERPTVVVTDLEMPIMDGYQLLRLLKSDPATAHAPVLIVTSHGEAPSRYWGLQTGADAYLTKDHRPEELIEAVGALVKRAGEPAPVSESAPQGPLDVLARVAHHLDTNLMQATLVNALLESGMSATDLHDAIRIALQTIAEVADAHLLGVVLTEPETVTLHMLLPQPLSLHSVDQCATAMLGLVGITPGAIVDAVVSGERNGGTDVDPSAQVSFTLPLRDAEGRLAVLPRDPAQFTSLSRHLVEAVVGHMALVLDNARLSQRLRELSMLDGLTRLLNHRSIHERLAEELERARRYDHPLSVVICDLDHFKHVNDRHGHLAGDSVLRGAVGAMKKCLRNTDAFGRYGGEEFLLVLPESDLESGRAAAERLRHALAEAKLPVPAAEPLHVTGSFGVAARSELAADASADALVSLADGRLYEAKAAGRNCVRP